MHSISCSEQYDKNRNKAKILVRPELSDLDEIVCGWQLLAYQIKTFPRHHLSWFIFFTNTVTLVLLLCVCFEWSMSMRKFIAICCDIFHCVDNELCFLKLSEKWTFSYWSLWESLITFYLHSKTFWYQTKKNGGSTGYELFVVILETKVTRRVCVCVSCYLLLHSSLTEVGPAAQPATCEHGMEQCRARCCDPVWPSHWKDQVLQNVLKATRERLSSTRSRHTCAPSEDVELVRKVMLWVSLGFLFCSYFSWLLPRTHFFYERCPWHECLPFIKKPTKITEILTNRIEMLKQHSYFN